MLIEIKCGTQIASQFTLLRQVAGYMCVSVSIAVYGVVSHKASHTLRPLLIYCASPSEFLSFLIHPPELSGNYQQRHLVAKQGETWREMSVNFAGEVSLSYSAGIFNMRHGTDGFTSPPKEVVLRIFIALKNPSASAGFEPANLESNFKFDKHYSAENDKYKCIIIFIHYNHIP